MADCMQAYDVHYGRSAKWLVLVCIMDEVCMVAYAKGYYAHRPTTLRGFSKYGHRYSWAKMLCQQSAEVSDAGV